MALAAPYKRTIRPFLNGGYKPKNGEMSFVRMKSYAENPRSHIRGFEILQREIRSVFEYIEPSDTNLCTYSEKIGKLLTAACFEVESNLKAILRENSYPKNPEVMTMADYCKVELSHKLSGYEVLLPEWAGNGNILKPFDAWAHGERLNWYQDYNNYKHDRSGNAKFANFGNMIKAWSGIFVLLSAQFFDSDFSIESKTIGFAPHFDSSGYNHGIGGYLKVKYPNWPDTEKYDFTPIVTNWDDMNFCQKFPY